MTSARLVEADGKQPMKRAALLLSLLCIALLGADGLPLVAQTSPLKFRVLAASAPNRYTAINGVAWTAYQTWVGRAMDSIENNKGDIGNPSEDPAAFEIVDSIVPRLWVVSGNPSWRGRLNPTGAFADQYGNSMHFVLHVQGDGTVRFKYEDISWCVWRTGQQGGVVCNTMALIWPDSGAAWDRIDCAHGTGYDWGADKKKGGGDDTEVCGGTQKVRGNHDATLVDEVFYVGANFGSAADYRYNKPVEWPDYADWTLQDHFDDFCQFYNNDLGYQEVGLEFKIIASDGNTYNYVAKRENKEFGRAIQPKACVPNREPPNPAATPAHTPTPKPRICTGMALQLQGYRITTRYGLCSGIQVRQVGTDAIGIQSILDAGFIDAVDVWGYAEQGVEVCIPANGRTGVLIFVDSNTTPRVITPLQSTLSDGFICASVSGPGNIVFVESWEGAPEPVPAAASATALQGCMVTATAALNFRDGPDGDIIGAVPYNASLTAIARADGWFQVDNNGVTGWISADYVTVSGDCD